MIPPDLRRPTVASQPYTQSNVAPGSGRQPQPRQTGAQPNPWSMFPMANRQTGAAAAFAPLGNALGAQMQPWGNQIGRQAQPSQAQNISRMPQNVAPATAPQTMPADKAAFLANQSLRDPGPAVPAADPTIPFTGAAPSATTTTPATPSPASATTAVDPQIAAFTQAPAAAQVQQLTPAQQLAAIGKSQDPRLAPGAFSPNQFAGYSNQQINPIIAALLGLGG